MRSNFYSLQYIISLLATHSIAVGKTIQNVNWLFKKVSLTKNDQKLLRQFILHHGERLKTSAILNERKRWDAVLALLAVTNKFVTTRALKHHWKKYLLSFDILTPVPETPLLDLIAFLEKASSDFPRDSLERYIVEYELIKNQILHAQPVVKNNNQIIKFGKVNQLNHCKGLFHPIFKFKKFPINVTNVISKTKKQKIDNPGFLIEKDPELLLFSKRWNSDSVVVIKVTRRIKNFVEKMGIADNLECLQLEMNLDQKTFLSYINMMVKEDLLRIVHLSMSN